MGISLAIDDFGTGYSSLSYLKHFPIDRLKIDRSFVCDITTNPDDAAIADAIIAMAHSLKLKVTAEGVEKQEQLAYLSSRNCDEMQGYFLSYPVPAAEFAAFVRSRSPGHIDKPLILS
jgi:EAL domain-containing protein (putative c-di-GMP-specific phosphodiesterase class I)